MRALGRDDLHRLRAERLHVGDGTGLAPGELAAIESRWRPLVAPSEQDESERFAVARPDGDTTGATAARWLFHLLGLSHRAAHVFLLTPAGLVVVQKRAATKADWPGAWDMAVAGHVPQHEDGSEMTFLEGALKEMEEELGLPADRLESLLAEGELTPLGPPSICLDRDDGRNPPFWNREVRQIFVATLSPEGLAALNPDPQEVAGVALFPPDEAWDLLARQPVASGLRHSLPRCLDWLARRRALPAVRLPAC